jgi:hypothetical protein
MTDWPTRRLGELLSYEQPGRYLVSSTDYLQAGGVPVLTAGKTFVLGHTSESWGVYRTLPVIIFDDFTTASKYVTFPFKVKSSAMKMLKARSGVNLRFVYERMQLINFPIADHKRRWITEFSKLEIPAPSLEEQQQIAGRIADCDDLIASLERLIAKKRNIKQGVMQELLTGRTRLQGFSDDWPIVRLGQVLRFQTGFPFPSAYFTAFPTGPRLVRNRDLRADDAVVHYTGSFLPEFVVLNGDVLVGMDGDFEPVIWRSGAALLNQRVGRLRTSSRVSGPYLSYALKKPLKELEGATGATTVKHLSHGDIEGMEISLPPREEQDSIADVLISVDAEIAALERRLESAHSIKQGMMQELLTGRTRLVTEAAA